VPQFLQVQQGAAMAHVLVELVEYHPAHLQELVLLWRASFEDGVGVVIPHSLSEQEEFFLTKVLVDNDVRLAFFEGQLVGFIAATIAAVAQLYVRKGFQRRGVGSAMLNWAKARSLGSLWLYTFAKNHAARAFYETQGFVAIAHGFEPSWQLEDVKYCWVHQAGDEGHLTSR
jgi:GNAT superfamily N-acetyltransferase